ncbi:MAG: hypothetical protein J6E31_03620 [Pyramidobacter sp.]|nr:hypothetical protein [Pyramidobacter sp.]
MDLIKLKTLVSGLVKQQEQRDTATQDEIIATIKPLYNAKIAAGIKPRAAIEALQQELANGGIGDITLTVDMFRTPQKSGFTASDKPPLRVVIKGWQSELRAMSRRGWTDAELVGPVIERVKAERPDLAAVAEQEITDAMIHEIIAKKRNRGKAFLPEGVVRPVADLVMSWRGQIKRLVERGWSIEEIVTALQYKVREECKGTDPAAITADLVQRVIDTGGKTNNDTPVLPASADTTIATTGSENKPVEMIEDDIDWDKSSSSMIYVKKDRPVPQIGQLWHRAKTSVLYRVLDVGADTTARINNGVHKVAVEVVA